MSSGRRFAAIAVLAAIAAAFGIAGAASGATQTTAGVVVINTDLSYQDASSAGTGIVISSAGEVLTNNHVIRGATTINVVDPGTGRRYAATVLGYSIGADVALLKLAKASGLTTVALGNSAGLRRGQTVSAVGNAGGTGKLVTTSGTITRLGASITVEDEQGTARLTGLIQTNANLEPGDSGGPLLDSDLSVIGMHAAASAGYAFRSGGNRAYAVPINKALAIAKQIRTGRSTAAIHVGPTAFLGVAAGASPTTNVRGALVAGVVSGGPAAKAGISPGDVITRIGGRIVTTTASIVKILLGKKPGQTIKVTWIDTVGNRNTATAKLAKGPPQ